MTTTIKNTSLQPVPLQEGLQENSHEDSLLLLCFVRSGEDFPTNPSPYSNTLIVVSFQFDEFDDVIELDPVPLTSEPNFPFVRIGFEMTSGQMHEFLAVNSSIQVKVKCINADQLDENVLIGSVSLPLQSACYWPREVCQRMDNRLPYKFHFHFLRDCHLKFTKSKLLVGLNVQPKLELDTTQVGGVKACTRTLSCSSSSGKRERSLKGRTLEHGTTREFKVFKPSTEEAIENPSSKIKLDPVLNAEKAYLELGPNPTHLYDLTIQILFAMNLSKLVKNPTKGSVYHYSFEFGDKIRSNGFENLDEPEFPPDSLVFKIASDPEQLRTLFGGKAEPMKVSLLCRDEELGSAFLPLGVFKIPSVESLINDQYNFEDVIPFEGFSTGSAGQTLPRLGYALELSFDKLLVEREQTPEKTLIETKNLKSWTEKALKIMHEMQTWKKTKNAFLNGQDLDNHWIDRDVKIRGRFKEIYRLSNKIIITSSSLLALEESLRAREVQLKSKESVFEESLRKHMAIDKALQAFVKKEMLLFKEDNEILRKEALTWKKMYAEICHNSTNPLGAKPFFNDFQCGSQVENMDITDSSNHSRNQMRGLTLIKTRLLAAGYSDHDDLIAQVDIEVGKLQGNNN